MTGAKVPSGERKQGELREMAQADLMRGIANVLGYHDPAEYGVELTEGEKKRYLALRQTQADRVARLLGFEEAWSN
ncbi:hypothetical protein [Pseudactinotalea sp.]|uniref:hypothetical protein n=1 Tax=Pseudactinotalea sp. TaxID=1926260 RepID=UPI003B3B6396